jgi:hypothetical protein
MDRSYTKSKAWTELSTFSGEAYPIQNVEGTALSSLYGLKNHHYHKIRASSDIRFTIFQHQFALRVWQTLLMFISREIAAA